MITSDTAIGRLLGENHTRPILAGAVLDTRPAPGVVMTTFDQAPFIAIWETTRACALACVHCRAEAISRRHPEELTPEEGQRLMDRVAAFGDPPPLLVLTGGDPLRRPDIVELVAYGTSCGLTVSLTPSGTAAATEDRLSALRDAGLARLAVSLDGASAVTHDAFRRVQGSHRHTMRILERARALGIPFQLNTTVCTSTVGELPALARRVEELGAVLWALFFLIPIGRADVSQALDADALEDVLRWTAELASRVPFAIKTTEAPHYHRVLAQHPRVEAPQVAVAPAVPAGTGADARVASPRGRRDIGRAGRAVTDGNGVVFIDHRGAICPSGFLPIEVGNVRSDDLVAVYRDHPLFRALRDPEQLEGRCGACAFRDRCGGSRARAWAVTGNPLAEDPGCAWQPADHAARPLPVIAGGSGPATAVTPEEVTQALREVFLRSRARGGDDHLRSALGPLTGSRAPSGGAPGRREPCWSESG